MQFRFDEKVDLAIRKSVRSTVRTYKEKRKTAQESGTPLKSPSFEEFSAVVHDMMESIMRKDMDHLRSPDMRDLLERTWSQKLRNFSTSRSIRDAYDSLVKKF